MIPAHDPAPRPAPRLAWGLVRLATAAALIAAIVAQLLATLAYAVQHDQHVPTVLANFFSFFTVESNVIGVVAMLAGGFWLVGRGRHVTHEPRGISVLMLCASTYMITTGIVYNTLLRGIPLPQGTTVPWSNEVLHAIGPAIFLLDVLLRVARRPQPARWAWIVAVFPIVWVVYTLARGELITSPATGQPWWYPYPFLNPYATSQGYLGVMMWMLIIAAVIVAIALLAARWSRMRRPQGESVPV